MPFRLILHILLRTVVIGVAVFTMLIAFGQCTLCVRGISMAG